MSLIQTLRTRRVALPRPRFDALPRPADPLFRAAGAAAVVALAGWLILLVPMLVVWATDPRSSVSAFDVLGVASGVWFAGHDVPVDIATTGTQTLTVTLAPLGLTAVYLAAAAWAAGRIDDPSADPDADPEAERRARRRADVGFLAGYLVAAGLVALCSFAGPTRPRFYAVPVVLVVPLLALGRRLLRRIRESPEGEHRILGRPVPVWLVRGLAPGLWGLAGLGAAGLLLALASLLWHVATFVQLSEAVDAGFVGTVALALGQVALAPNAAVWGLAFLAGPGFQIGTGSSISPAGSTPGLMPLVPMFAGLPGEGGFPVWLRALALVPVLLGGLVAWRCERAYTRLAGPRAKALSALTAVLVATLGADVVATVGSGSVGLDRLSAIGPHLLPLTAALLLELALGAACRLGYTTLRARLGR